MSFGMALTESTRISGVGIHSGKENEVLITPGSEGAGVRFLVKDRIVPASVDCVVDARRCTSLGVDGVRIDMVEHLLSALFALNVQNADIHLDGGEMPILDGGAAEWIKALKPLLRTSGNIIPTRTLHEPIARKYNDSVYCAIPSDRMRLTCIIDFPHPLIGLQISDYLHDATDYAKDIAPARTFGFIEEVEALHTAGLGLGGDFGNTLVVYPDHYSTPELLPSECCRHKLLDMIGDFSLGNGVIAAAITAYKPSHFGNTTFLKVMLEEITTNKMQN
jgi:UDP-3-O-[3-hydroxymyristoyl] N-acetylglucosamine deacetylase